MYEIFFSVIDDHQLDRHFSQNDIKELYKFRAEKLPDPQPIASLIADNSGNFPYPIPTDHLLLDLLYEHHRWIHSYHSHDSLLENKLDEGLTADERKRGKTNLLSIALVFDFNKTDLAQY